ncbi:PREDICTED: uncharacterized protein LOC106806854 [Priapulus caudatus]|uniref:Uncharacterized protein LOC106806854 n=1 Tax=Priapulus caudatus TaxID=37621 RepID=A0ABM1DX03_PRICU|nr:PREDICTED: uncharacterized protein LOC106806854 [Priapulus caudatus]
MNNLTDVILSRMVAADEQVTSTQCNYQRRTIAHFPFDDNFREDAATHILVNAPRVGDSQYVKGVKFVPGVFGRCVEFNSPRAKELTYQGGFSTDNNRNYTWNKGFTISVWFRRPESSGEDELGIAGYINGEVGVFELFIGIKDQRSNSSFSQQPTSFGNTWHHVVITSNGETSSERVYIDGLETQRHLMALASYLLISNNVKTAIPNKMDFVISTSQKNDLVDELVIVDCALPPVEVLRMYADYSRRLLVNVGK